MEVKFSNYECVVKKSIYNDSKQIKLSLIDKNDGMPVATATIELTREEIEPNEVAIKSYSENEGIYEVLLEAGIIGKVKRFAHLTFVKAHICELLNFED